MPKKHIEDIVPGAEEEEKKKDDDDDKEDDEEEVEDLNARPGEPDDVGMMGDEENETI